MTRNWRTILRSEVYEPPDDPRGLTREARVLLLMWAVFQLAGIALAVGLTARFLDWLGAK